MIDHGYYGRYDHRNKPVSKGARMNRPPHADARAVRARLDAGEWLTPGEVAKLFGVTRWTVINWIKANRIGYRERPSGHRVCDPEHVRVLLAEYEQRRGPEHPVRD